jgi:hypothetical protein
MIGDHTSIGPSSCEIKATSIAGFKQSVLKLNSKAHHRPEPPHLTGNMENVICSCSNCKSELGCFRNSWNGIGNTYYSPVYPPAAVINGFEATSNIYKATDKTQIEGS